MINMCPDHKSIPDETTQLIKKDATDSDKSENSYFEYIIYGGLAGVAVGIAIGTTAGFTPLSFEIGGVSGINFGMIAGAAFRFFKSNANQTAPTLTSIPSSVPMPTTQQVLLK